MLYLLGSIFFGVLSGVAAKKRNRDPFVWFFAGAFGSVIALIIVISMPYICPHCKKNFAINSDGSVCGSCGKSEAQDGING
ncbi:MAG: hypothetical protein K6L81_18120 [Agarilytica sp.]